MIDTTAYNVMHGDKNEEPEVDRIELDADAMRTDNVPSEPFLLLLPIKIRGYGFHNKNWSKSTRLVPSE
jgi:hypothetical protein